MNKKACLIIILLVLDFLPVSLYAQDYTRDSLAIRAILDSNGFYSISVDSVADSSEGRIWRLKLNAHNLTGIPPEIEILTHLKYLELRSNDLTSIPDSIVNLTPTGKLDLGYNKLDTNTLSDTVIYWLDTYDPDWLLTQNVPIIYIPNFVSTQQILFIHSKNSSIHINLPTSEKIRLDMLDLKGRILSTLINSYKQAGTYSVHWDSHEYGSGIYYFKLSTGNNIIIKQAVLVR